MLCSNCNFKLTGTENNCPNCGILVPKNNNIIKKNNKGLKRTKNVMTVSVVVFVVSFIAALITGGFNTEITGKEFDSLLSDNGYIVTRVSIFENNDKIEEMYTATKNGSSEEIAYVKVIDSFADYFYDQLKERDNACKSSKINNTIVYAISCEDKVAEEAFKIIGYNNNSNIFLLGIFLPLMVLAILYFASIYKLFEKAGKKGYYSLIPIVSQYNMCDIAFDTKGSLLTIMFIASIIFPPVGWIINYNIGKKFGKSTLFSLGLVFFGIILFPILAADDEAVYIGKN